MANIKLDPIIQEIRVELESETTDFSKLNALIKRYDLLREKAVGAGESTEELQEEFKELVAEINKLNPALDKGGKEIQRYTTLQKNATTALQKQTLGTRDYTSAANNANQITFAFGDALQDSAQFQFGFAQGARAIGNNLAFAAEQFAITARNAGGAGQAIKALGASFLGPAGIILVINAAITLFTVFGEKLFSAKEETDEFQKALEELNTTLKDQLDLIEQIEEKGLSPTENELARVERLRDLSQQQLKDLELEAELAQEAIDETLNKLRDIGDFGRGRFGLLAQLKEQENRQEQINTKIDVQRQNLEQLRLKYIQVGDAATQALSNVIVEGVDDGLGFEFPSGEFSPSFQQQLLDRSAALREKFRKEDVNSFEQTEGEKFAILQAQKDRQARFNENFRKQQLKAEKLNFFALAQIATTITQGLFSNDKQAAIATAIIQGALAVQRTLASVPFPFSLPLVAGVSAATAKQIQTIRNTEIGSNSAGATGGSGGSSGIFSTSQSRGLPTFGAGNGFRESVNVVIQGDIANANLAVRVKKGNRELKTGSVSVVS